MHAVAAVALRDAFSLSFQVLILFVSLRSSSSMQNRASVTLSASENHVFIYPNIYAFACVYWWLEE